MKAMPEMATGGPVLTRNSSEFEVGGRLAAIRSRRGLSQGTVARLAGIPPSYLSRIETGHVHPTFSTVLRLMGALHAELDELSDPDAIHPLRHAACPVTAQGRCLLELIRTETQVARAEGREVYSLRELRLLQELAAFMRKGRPDRVRAIEMLIEELIEKPTA